MWISQLDPKRLADRRHLLDPGDAAAQHVDAAHVRGAAQDPVGAGVQAAGGDFWREDGDVQLAAQFFVGRRRGIRAWDARTR